MENPIIKVENLSYQYPHAEAGISGISFSLNRGEVLGVIGPSGAGKSTLVQTLNGYLEEISGNISALGIPLNKKSSSKIRRNIGIVFQNPDDQLFLPTVWEDVLFGLHKTHLSEEEINKQGISILNEFNVYHLKDRLCHTLSDGEKRAVAMAGVLIIKPEILILDEPTSNLDSGSRRTLIQKVQRLEQTKIIVSHDLDFILETTSKTLLLAKGKKMAFGDTVKILRDKDLLQQNGLELPIRFQFHQDISE